VEGGGGVWFSGVSEPGTKKRGVADLKHTRGQMKNQWRCHKNATT